MTLYRKKPVEARQLTLENYEDVSYWIAENGYSVKYYSKPPLRQITGIVIVTLDGDKKTLFGDYIIKNALGEFDSCTSDVFEAMYEEIK